MHSLPCICLLRVEPDIGETLRRVLQVTGAVGWRKDNIKYKKNEVFLDIVEQVCSRTSS